jgi:hypothetical protein
VTASDAVGLPLTYRVELSEPASRRGWWRVANTGSGVQVAAALNELATRVDLDNAGHAADGHCWYSYEVRWPDGVMLEAFAGSIDAVLIPGELRGLAAILVSATAHGRGDS